ncbi:WecB/TagA/CpsF family glycosyltransferase [Thermosediminibacter litoriperuensis]|uniref:N-acetylglucosaminyldiphosphoundecaprenol N-acetyl-beta-D-mannosaminyltransferase n=1 Tax=Thermosediminibacter litoriperuensis TaxID=291989 RepID=A0A5S5AZL6_9FIRM|nr:WecB/TagA/CpsF family glycosyltransferase [Thermosediminibacter litoriperuensis]TYP57814.1 N-acetylmannosaminyltransferase [Thermosediminibacter litoriperuensis]
MRQAAGRIEILGVPLDRVTLKQAASKVEEMLESGGTKVIVTPNAEIIMAAQKDIRLRRAIMLADLSLPDGIGVVIASRILEEPLPERVAGFDLMMEMLKIADRRQLSVYLLGGKPGVAEESAAGIKAKFPGVRIAGTHHGYFDLSQQDKVVDEINGLKPHFIFVGMGAPRQEVFMVNNKDKIRGGIMMGVGGSLDVLAGRVSRAPQWMQRLGFEWFYRLVQEPSRIKRMVALPLFLLKVLGVRGRR